MRHLFNGQAAANLASRAHLDGEMIIWHEALTHGPVPFAGSRDEWIAARAFYISRELGEGEKETAAVLRGQEDRLHGIGSDSLAVWVERDLSCQLTLGYVCARLARENVYPYRSLLVKSPDAPTGFAKVQPEGLQSLWEARTDFSTSARMEAADVFEAYCSSDPTRLQELVAGLADGWMRETMTAHFRRFPSRRDGLGSVERATLEAAAGGPRTFTELFVAVSAAQPLLGLGDLQLLSDVRRLSRGHRALLEVRGDDGSSSPENVQKIVIALTADGESVLDGRLDAVEALEGEYWLGGVHIVAGARAVWRWEETLQRIVRG
jgi:hypothetical protein